MADIIQQLLDLKEWSQDSARYERRLNFRGGQLVQPRQGFYKKGFVKPNRLTKEEIDQRYKAKKLKENPNYKAEADRRWKAKKLRENPDWSAYKAGTHYRKRVEAGKKGLIYDKETKKFRKARKIFTKYNKFVEAADRKIINEWGKSLTDAAKAGDMSETLGFKTYLTKKYGAKKAQTIRNRVRLQLNFAPGEVSDTIQENFIDSLVKKHNEADKVLYSKKDIFDKVVIDRNLGRGREIYFNLDNRLENLDTKINRAFDKIVDNNLPIKASKKVMPHVATYNPIVQMISESSGAGSNRTIQEALLKNPKFQDKEFVETFKYLGRAHAKDLVGLPFDEAFEYAKMRQGGLDVKGLVSYTTRYQNPESNIMNFAVRHANRHFREGTKSQVQFYKLRADGTKGAPMPWDKLPKNRDGNRILDLKKVGFEYKNQFFHRNNLKTKGYKSGLFDEVYAMSGKNRLLVPDPNDLSQKITLKKLLQMTGDKLTLGHDEALGGVKGSPFKNLRLQGEKLNTALFNAYDKIQNKDLRARVLNSLEGQFKGLSGGDYQKAFIEGKVKEAQDILNKKVDLSKTGTLYREAGREIVTDPVFKTFSPKKQREAMRIAGNKIMQTYQANGIGGNCKLKSVKKAEGGRIGFAAGGYDQCMNNAIQEHNKNLKSDDLTLRNEARAKQFNINKTKNMKSLMSLGARGGKNVLKLGRTWGIELEPIFEGAFYEWGRRKGLTHGQAKEETFFWKMLDPSTKTGLLEGAEPLLEKELYQLKGEEEFMDVDNRPPMQDPEFGQVIGERKSVKRYIENEKALAAAYEKYNQLYNDYQVATSGRKLHPEESAQTAERLMKDSEVVWEEIKELEKQLNYDRDMYQAAVEKQQTEQGVRAIEYGEYGQGDTPELARRREKERYRLMNEKFPSYGKAQIDQKLEDWGYYVDPNLRSYKGQTVQRPEGLEYIGKPVLKPDAERGWTYDDASDFFKDQDKMDYFAENFRTEKAGGGIAGIRRPNAIPPESGPVPQGGGLSTMFNRVKPW
jgi:hypothetical protein